MSVPMTLSKLESQETGGPFFPAVSVYTLEPFDLVTKLGMVTHVGAGSVSIGPVTSPIPVGEAPALSTFVTPPYLSARTV